MNNFIKKLSLILFLFVLINLIIFILFKPIFYSNHILITFCINPFNICEKYPHFWNNFKKVFIISNIISSIIISNFLSLKILALFKKTNSNNIIIPSKLNKTNDSLSLLVGLDNNNNKVYIPEKGLFQNILVTGTIGSGKTSSLLYPLTEQLISFKSENYDEKISMLILDVKGNYYKQVIEYCRKYNRSDDLIIVELNSSIKYNPLDKPHLKPHVLANRLITILSLFSNNNSDSYWLDKSEQIISECIKLCRLYNDNYVTFEEIHKIIMYPQYYKEKILLLKDKFLNKKLSNNDICSLSSIIDFFENEFLMLDSKVLSILKSEISRITNIFISDKDIKNTFCPQKENITFKGFKETLSTGKIVVLNMNISEYSSLSKIISAYLKLDFQSEVLSRLSTSSFKDLRTSCFISDEYQEYITLSDANFYAQSREAKCINIVATQSYSSLLNTLNNEYNAKVIIQNLINKFWFRTDDIFTIEEAQKQIGKSEKTFTSNTISENAKQTSYNYFTNSFISMDSNISESINTYKQLDLTYDTKFFTQDLKTFSCLSFISTGNKIFTPQEIKTIPYFKQI
ncbi:MAG: hypothetical protein HFJ43_00755 [Clostridia bacterium]|nr:hypothetical protein [Clostridia bacterium]